MKKTKKNLRPIDIDAHLKYRCQFCSGEHWLSLKQTQIKNFKVACYCGKVFKPKQIDKIAILYVRKTISKKLSESDPFKENIQNIPTVLLEKCSKILIQYGFTLDECNRILNDSYSKNPTNDHISLIKQSLASLKEENNDPTNETI